ncbi:hypothetical protein FACS189419_03080 [Planctomycetales bacterium]|nr:hypothetical protein FACS189419_03080 [Planctomycetales bacterium]
MRESGGVIGAVPQRLWVYGFLLFGGIAAVASLEYAYYYLPVILNFLKLSSFPALDLTGQENAMKWLTSSFLLVSAAFAWVNFRLCVRFSDRIELTQTWFWASVVCCFLSLDIQTDLHNVVKELLIRACGNPYYRDGSILYLAVYGAVAGLIVLRLLVNMLLMSFPALMFLAVSAAGIVAGQLVSFDILTLPVPYSEPREQMMLQAAIPALSALSLLMSFGLFARRQCFRDPEWTLRWAARMWNHGHLLNLIEEKQPLPKKKPAAVPPTVQKPETKNKPAPHPPTPVMNNPPKKTEPAAVNGDFGLLTG